MIITSIVVGGNKVCGMPDRQPVQSWTSASVRAAATQVLLRCGGVWQCSDSQSHLWAVWWCRVWKQRQQVWSSVSMLNAIASINRVKTWLNFYLITVVSRVYIICLSGAGLGDLSIYIWGVVLYCELLSRFIPDDTEFTQQPVQTVSELPSNTSYTASQYFNSALQQSKVKHLLNYWCIHLIIRVKDQDRLMSVCVMMILTTVWSVLYS